MGAVLLESLVPRSALYPELKERPRSVLLGIGADPPASLTRFGLVGFAPAVYEHYVPEGNSARARTRVYHPATLSPRRARDELYI